MFWLLYFVEMLIKKKKGYQVTREAKRTVDKEKVL
jgi:hypothetical protein